jgi:hypothetical protein
LDIVLDIRSHARHGVQKLEMDLEYLQLAAASVSQTALDITCPEIW